MSHRSSADDTIEVSTPFGSSQVIAKSSRPKMAQKMAQVGRYKLCYELGSGGMASVYLARAEGPGGFRKHVALKQVRPQLASERNFVEMFLDEAAIASQIHHPNVCTVFDFGEADQSYFLAMEYLLGQPLSNVMRQLARSPAVDAGQHAVRAAKIISDASEGLHAAHELKDSEGNALQVVHRDVAPDNIFLTFDGVTKIMDFGVASATQRIHKTTTGELKGKHAYMAPEQLHSEGVDRRMDVWSLGVVLWELLTLTRLFKRSTHAQTLFAVVTAPIPKPSSVQRDLPRELDRIVMKALCRDPEKRYATARALGEDLRSWMRASPMTHAELGEWLDALFPGSKELQARYVQSATEMTPGAPTLPAPSWTVSSPSGAGGGSARQARELVDKAQRRARIRKRLGWAALFCAAFAAGWFGLRRLSETALEPVDGTASGSTASSAAAPSGSVEHTTLSEQVRPEQATEENGAHAFATQQNRKSPAAGSDSVVEPASETPVLEGSDAAPAPPARTAPSQARPAPRKATPPRRGKVAVSTPGGWAVVYDGKRSLGQTPTTLTLPAGRHELQLRPFGKRPAKHVSVWVKPASTRRVVVPVEP